MPRATVSRETVHYDLQTLEGGFVELRTLSYYEMMQRRDIMARISTEQSGSRRDRSTKQIMEMMNAAVTEYEFKTCISNHNLEDENGVRLDFNNPLALRSLDPKIGAEIGRYIDELNKDDDSEDLDSSPTVATLSSQDGETQRSETTPEEHT
jgi:hypothetical protein